jgi:membrane protein required for colicin V production
MNWLDIVILAVVVVATLVGLKLGIIKAVLSLAGTAVGVILAGRYYADLAGLLTFISQPSLAKVAAFAIILVGVMLVAAVLAAMIKWVASAVMLGWLDRLGGAALGLVLGAIFSGAILTIWVKFGGATGVVHDSALAAFLLDGFPMVLALLPSEFDSVRAFFQ